MDDFVHYTLANDVIDKKESKINISELLKDVNVKTKKPDALFSQIEVASSIIKELQKIEETDNIFFSKNIIINNIYTITISNFSDKYEHLTLKLILDKDYYPFVPPDITILPSIDPMYIYEMIQSPELDISNMNNIRNIDFVINTVREKINGYNINCTLNSELTNEMLKLLKNNNYKLHRKEDKQQTKKTIKSISGVGYGGSIKDWDVNSYLNNVSRIKETNITILENIVIFIENHKENKDLFEIHTKFSLYTFWIDLLEKYEITETQYYSSIKNVLSIIKYLNLKINIPFFQQFIIINKDENRNNLPLVQNINNLINDIQFVEENVNINNDIYVTKLKELQYDEYPYTQKERHAFVNQVKSFTNFVNSKTTHYILRLYKQLSTNLPITNGSGIFFRYDTTMMSLFKFLIIPNEDTPYKYGCFVFDVFLPADFPNVPPIVNHSTSSKNNFRFNPNLYACGKVCLSLLGTWGGQSQSEKWIAPNENNAGSTFLQLVLSIYSMIFTEYPWFNEPGRERDISDAKKNYRSNEYNDELRAGTIKYAIMNQIKYPEDGFENVIKSHFKVKKNEIIEYMKNQKVAVSTINSFAEYADK
jgi:ubiquitin-protein ligase